MSGALRVSRSPAFIIGTIALVAVGFVAVSLRRPQLDEHAPTPHGAHPEPDSLGNIRFTIDATADEAWQHFNFDRRAVVAPDDTLGWDLAFRRFHIKARDPANAIERWYDYSWTSHILKPKPTSWTVRTTSGRHARMRILSYYCIGARPGCITLEYVLE